MTAFLLALFALSTPPPADEAPRFAGRDPFALLGSHRVELGEDGAPLVTVGIAKGEEEVAIHFPEGAILHLPDGGRLEARPRATWRFAIRRGVPAIRRYRVQVGQHRFDDREGLRKAKAAWESQGYRVKTKTLGAVFAIAGRMVDTRRQALLLGGGSREDAETLLAKLGGAGPLRGIFEEVIAPATGVVEVRDAAGEVLGRALGAVYLKPRGVATVKGVEHDMGYAAHGREDRSYGGGLFVTVDAEGKLAAVNLLRLEDLLRGIVPSEIFATAPEAALEAQAVAARGEVLAKIGARHLADPFHLCAEQHCQVYKGRGGEHPRTSAAVEATRGQLLFGAEGRLVDTVYSSTCGGHTEDNEAVWGTPPSPHLRGRPDVWETQMVVEGSDGAGSQGLIRRTRTAGAAEGGETSAAGGTTTGAAPGLPPAPEAGSAFEGVPPTNLSPGGSREALEAFLARTEGWMCGASSFARPEKLRWTREFSDAALAVRLAPLGVGKLESMEVLGRGASGRAIGLRLRGTEGEVEIRGELNIRRLFGNLNSSLFVIDRLPGGWRFRGAGWGHGVGMCQMGAIGRAERGADHEAILRHYYPGSELRKLY